MKIYDAQINVELCSSVKFIKYVTKYIKFSLQSTKKVEQFRFRRDLENYIFQHTRASTSYYTFSVHLLNGQPVYFTENNINNVVKSPQDTTLRPFFNLCSEDNFARTLTCDKVPAYYTCNQVTKKIQTAETRNDS